MLKSRQVSSNGPHRNNALLEQEYVERTCLQMRSITGILSAGYSWRPWELRLGKRWENDPIPSRGPSYENVSHVLPSIFAET
jgi:hypothetical protein